MPTNYKVLGQVEPVITTDTVLYTVPALTETIISTIVVANKGVSNATFRISVRPSGEALAGKHYIAYDVTIGALDSTTITLGITMSASDVLGVHSSTADLSFNAFGSEVTS